MRHAVSAHERLAQGGLYLLTPPCRAGGEAGWFSIMEQVLGAGIPMLQYRDKTASPDQRREHALRLRNLCLGYDTLLIINDDVGLALEVDAHGVHLGRSDCSIAAARQRSGEHFIIGASCYADLIRARDCAAQGADYLAFGALFPSQTKPEAPPAPLSLLRDARRRFDCPIVAIGGIKLDHAPRTITQGADWLAVSHDVFASPDPGVRIRAYAAIFAGLR